MQECSITLALSSDWKHQSDSLPYIKRLWAESLVHFISVFHRHTSARHTKSLGSPVRSGDNGSVHFLSWQAVAETKQNRMGKTLRHTTPQASPGTPKQPAGCSALECCRVSKYWKLAFPLGDVAWKVRTWVAAAASYCFSPTVPAVSNGIQKNCMTFPMMGTWPSWWSLVSWTLPTHGADIRLLFNIRLSFISFISYLCSHSIFWLDLICSFPLWELCQGRNLAAFVCSVLWTFSIVTAYQRVMQKTHIHPHSQQFKNVTSWIWKLYTTSQPCRALWLNRF